MLVDRNELEEQLFTNLSAVGYLREEVEARSMEHLQELLASDRRGLIVSTIHKFDRMPERMNERSNIFVLVDEAHRTTSGDLGNYLVGALPNATYIGFTGTPIDKTVHGKGTFKVFGPDDPRGYLDKYSIRESINDGTTVPLHYALAPNEMLVDRETLEREFLSDAAAEGISDIEDLNRVLQKAVTLRNMLKSPDRVEKVAAYIAKHFRETVEPMGYKAFVVTVDREACALYKDALDKHLPSDYSEVIISQGAHDAEILRRFHYSEQQEEAVRKAFRKSGELPRLLIVTDKLLTGFDAPLLYCLYLDKPMRDHVLLQAIARVNRPYEDAHGRAKPAGFVLDFVGVFERLERALAFDSEDVSGVVEGINVLQEEFARRMAEAKERYFSIAAGLTADKEVEAVLEHFRDSEARQDFYRFFEETQATYEILSPDPFLRPYLDDYDRLLRIYQTCRANYDRGIDVDRTFLKKTARRLQEQTVSPGVEPPSEVFELGAEELQRLSEEQKPDTVKVFNLLKSIHKTVEERHSEEPFLISIGERAEEIAQAFEERQASAEEALQMLLDLSEEAVEAESAQQKTGLTPDAFAVLWYLRGKGLSEEMAEGAARAAEDAFAAHPHWRASADQEREVRLRLYKALIAAGEKARSPELVRELLSNLSRAA